MNELDVDQIRSVDLTALVDPGHQVFIDGTHHQSGKDRRRVCDDHARSRPDRTAVTILFTEVPPDRAAARLRTSETAGRSATRLISARRYSDNERPASAAQELSVRWTWSGTSRIWIDLLMVSSETHSACATCDTHVLSGGARRPSGLRLRSPKPRAPSPAPAGCLRRAARPSTPGPRRRAAGRLA